eukprot:gene14983-biopygen5811
MGAVVSCSALPCSLRPCAALPRRALPASLPYPCATREIAARARPGPSHGTGPRARWGRSDTTRPHHDPLASGPPRARGGRPALAALAGSCCARRGSGDGRDDDDDDDDGDGGGGGGGNAIRHAGRNRRLHTTDKPGGPCPWPPQRRTRRRPGGARREGAEGAFPR